jgi:hypothetical protein
MPLIETKYVPATRGLDKGRNAVSDGGGMQGAGCGIEMRIHRSSFIVHHSSLPLAAPRHAHPTL